MLRWKNKSLQDVDKTKLLRNSGSYGILLVALLAMTFFGVCDPQSGQSGPKGSAAKVNGDVITSKEFQRAYRDAYQTMQQQYADAFDPEAMQLSRSVIRQLVDERILFAKAQNLGMRVSENEVLRLIGEAELFKDEKGAFNAEAFGNFLRNQGYSEASFMAKYRRSLTVQKFREYVTQTSYVSRKAAELDYKISETKIDVEYLKFDPADIKVDVSDGDVTAFLTDDGKKKVKEFYDANKSDYVTTEQVRARHVLVGFTGARNASAEANLRTKADAKKRAEDVLMKVKAPGADFAKIAKEMTDEASGKAKGGDLGFFNREAMVKEFSDAAFALKAGEISGVVESPFGFHVIKLEETKAAKNETLEQATNAIARKLVEKERKPKVAGERAAAAMVSVKEGKDPGSGAVWKSTGDIAVGSRFIPGLGSEKTVTDAVATLIKAGDLYPAVVEARDTRYILRLKNRKEPDMAKFNDAKRKELADSASFSQGYAIFGAIEKTARKDLEAKGRIWENPEYVTLDTRQAKKDGAGSGGEGAGS